MSGQRRVDGEWALEEAGRMVTAAQACLESAHAGIEGNYDATHGLLDRLEQLADEIDVVHAMIDRELRRLRRPTVVPIGGLKIVPTEPPHRGTKP